jgi:alpha-D-ribose 1-methylphosphonate 5-triphosphate synthase subunit PhnG
MADGRHSYPNPGPPDENTLSNRANWVRALTAHPPERVLRLASDLSQAWQVSHEALPQTGLSLLQLQDSVFQEAYYLGEIPLSTAWVQLQDSTGNIWSGAAQVMSDIPDLAIALAICDAVLQHQLPGWQQVAEQVYQGRTLYQRQDHLRGAMLTKTRVDFSLLSQEKSDDPD